MIEELVLKTGYRVEESAMAYCGRVAPITESVTILWPVLEARGESRNGHQGQENAECNLYVTCVYSDEGHLCRVAGIRAAPARISR